ncbi:hypothetical protein JEQ21_00455 [Streptococcus sp. 121]|uniref:hypothetical protein n=1 Tax=Streptococcus sp. 121 TaxID=2797637 RepID=UPI0018F088AC|nr:hypothetical protein [Streptococcus sp. 121]MBJ6744940.1 hypothetical protein [Streptococcus sp. 121]
MKRVMKIPSYLKLVCVGMSTIVLPTFFQNQDIPRIKTDKLTAGQRVQLDYLRSLNEIKQEAVSFDYKQE